MRFLNGWKYKNKQWDKFEFRLRFGVIDVLRIKYDHSDKYFEFSVFNLGGKFGGRWK